MTNRPIIRGRKYSRTWIASGTLNFFGNGWPYHWILKFLFPRGFNFLDSIFVAKTTTLPPRKGNLMLNRWLQPILLFFVLCIRINPFKKIALNAVSLSGPGAAALFMKGLWQERMQPFFISFMTLEKTVEARIKEFAGFLDLLEKYLPTFINPWVVGLKINITCPNTEQRERLAELRTEVFTFLKMARQRFPNMPLGVKINIFAPVEFVRDLQDSGLCDFVVCSNTIPFGTPGLGIDWSMLFPIRGFFCKLFGKVYSPLKKYGGGGLSGEPLFPLVLDWVKKMRTAGITLPIVAGGGILKKQDAIDLLKAGATAIFLGSIVFLRPWRIREIVVAADEY